MAQVNAGDVVRVHCTGRLADGTVFTSSRDGAPLEFTAGGTEMIEGISQAVIDMQHGEKKTVTVPPEQGYGARVPGLRHEVDRAQLPGDIQLGDRLIATAGDQRVPVWVVELNDEAVVLDGNHPFAGQTLAFDIEVVSVGSQ